MNDKELRAVYLNNACIHAFLLTNWLPDTQTAKIYII